MRAGHELHLLCQDRSPLELAWVDAAGDWDARRARARRPPRSAARDRLPARPRRPAARLRRRPLRGHRGASLRGPRRCGGRRLRRAQRRGRRRGRRARAPRRRARQPPRDGPADPRARAAGRRAVRGQDPRQRARVHGQAHPRFLPAAREGLAGARGVLVGSRHTAESLWAALREPGLRERTRLGPPGVDVAPLRAARAGRGRGGTARRCASGSSGATDADAGATVLVRALERRGRRGARRDRPAARPDRRCTSAS